MNKLRVKNFFFQNPTAKKRVRELEREINVSLPSIIRYCKELKKEGILTTLQLGNSTFYTANSAEPSFIQQKKLFNLQQIYESDIIEYIKKELSNPIVILFGSYAKGEDRETSDIDIYIESPSKKKIFLEPFERKLQRKIQVFRHKSLKDIQNIHLKNNILNGVVLNNQIEAFT